MRWISGTDLKAIISAGHLDRIIPEYVALSPEDAIARIRNVFGRYPSRSGGNISGIRSIRDLIYDISADDSSKNAIMIVAPHTHWDALNPITICSAAGRYIIGCASPSAERLYLPISFVITSDGIVPFEWIDDSIYVEMAEYEIAYNTCFELSMHIRNHRWPLGLSLNYRFKSLMAPEIKPTLEYPLDVNDAPSSPSAIVLAEEFMGQKDNVSFQQVAWHSYSDKCYNIDDNGQRVLSDMREILDNADDNTRRKVYERIHG